MPGNVRPNRLIMAERGNYTYAYPHPAVTCDCVVFGYDGNSTKVLLIERGSEPYKGLWAFPGGFVEMNENADDCAVRELKEETNLTASYVEQLHTFSEIGRDPRERVITIAYYMLVKKTAVKSGDDASKAKWFSLDNIPHLAFDHDRILRKAMSRLKEQMHTGPVGFDLLPEEFSMDDLQNLYESILEVHFDQKHFSSKILQLGFVDQIEDMDGCKKYQFNKTKYDQMKSKGFRLEF